MYRNLLKSFLLLLCIGTQANALTDDRLLNIAPVISQIDAGNTIKPLNLNLSEFVYIQEIKFLRDKLKNHINLVLPNGKIVALINNRAPTRIELPFNELLRTYLRAFVSNNSATIQFLKSNFKPTRIKSANIVAQYGHLVNSSQVIIKKLLQSFQLQSLSKDSSQITLMQLYFAIGGELIKKNQLFHSYEDNQNTCFVLPNQTHSCMNDQEVITGIKRALNAHTNLSSYESKLNFNKFSGWRTLK
jgi:hypothetical protein